MVALLAGAGLAGLGGPAVGAEPAGKVVVRFIPGDRFTSVGGSPLALLVGDGSDSLDRRGLEALAAGLTLESWPDGRPVAGKPEIQDLVPDSRRARIAFVPAAALGDGWYRLSATLPPSFAAAGDARPAGAGRWGVRFRGGAQMVVRSLRACREGDDLRLDVALSERAAAASWPSAVAVRQGRTALACTAIVPPPPPGEAKPGDFGAGEIAYRCPRPDAAAPLDVEIGRTLVSLGGLAAGGPEEVLAYRLAAPALWPERCFTLRPAGRAEAGPGARAVDLGREVAP
jgi:hypothetical protein